MTVSPTPNKKNQSGMRMWPFAGMSLSAAADIGTIANWALLCCLLGGVLATFVIVKTTDIKEEHWTLQREASDEKLALAHTRASELEVALEKAKNEAKQIDANLLREQRLTASQFERLKRVESFVLPRTERFNWQGLKDELAKTTFSPINMAIVDKPHEALWFGIGLSEIFKQAGKLNRLIIVEMPERGFDMATSSGVMMLMANEEGAKFAQFLWHKFEIADGSFAINHLGVELSEIPKDTNCLLISRKGETAGPGRGGAGESLDERNRPLPR